MKNITLLILIIAFVSCKNGDKATTPEQGSMIETQDTTAKNELKQLEANIIQNPNSEIGYLERARYYYENDNQKMAMKDVKKAILLDSINADINYLQALIYVKDNQLDLAIPFFEKTLKSDSLHIEACTELAYYYLAAKNYDLSMELINRVLKKDRFLAKPYYLKGLWYEQQQDNKLAISSYQTALERNSTYYEAYLALGNIHNRIDDPLALQYFNSALSLKPESIEAWRAKGMSYYEHEDYENAIICFDTILYFDSSFEVSYFDIGRTLIDLCYVDNPTAQNDSLLKESISNFNKALELNPNYTAAKFNRALCYETLGNLELAASEYRAILKMEVNYEPAIQALNKLER